MMRRKSNTDAVKMGSKMNATRPKRRGSPPQRGLKLGRSKSDGITSEGMLTVTPWTNIKGIMKITTLDKSLHSVYGSESSQASENGKKKIQIRFENIEIREYARTVGDNPSVSSGPPITISWEYNPNTTILKVEEYEKARPVRRTQSQMILPRAVRVEMLRKEWAVSNHQIVSAVRSGVRAKNQRRTTLGNLGRTEKVEEMIEGATKQLLKALFLRKSTSTRAHELEMEVQMVNKQRAQIVVERTTKSEYGGSASFRRWSANLERNELESDLGFTQHKALQERMEQTKIREDWFKATSTNKVDSIRKPCRPEPSGPDADVSSLSMRQEWHLQSTGESASQSQAARPVITAVEPDGDLLDVKPTNSSLPIEC